jgi:glycosyltransferase involved in cell wall biosynthesis
LCGDGITWDNQELTGWIDAAHVRDCFHLLGQRDDIPRLTAALDISTLSSAFGETFGIVIAEAMACGVPCVATDLAIAGQIVGNTGRVVPIKQPHAMSAAWQELIELGSEQRYNLGQQARQRVQDYFSLSATITQYETLYKELAGYAQ